MVLCSLYPFQYIRPAHSRPGFA